MQLWFSERHTPRVEFSIMVDKQLFSGQSEHQRIDVFDSIDFGRILTLDGYIMLTERDEYIYHEMIVHVPMAVNPDAKSVLVVGGGDGGVVRELARYQTIESIDLVEIDQIVVDVCKQYIPATACAFDDKRVNIFFEDGLRYVRRYENLYDLIIVDSTDPFGPGEGLFTKEFYGSCYKALNECGILVSQHTPPFYSEDTQAMQRAHECIFELFPVRKVYQANIPTYPSGNMLFGFASKRFHPIHNLHAEEWNTLGMKMKYYNTNLHIGAFALPNYVEDLLRDVEK